ncbi:MAG: hypothetical protein ACFCVD_01495 [Nodosilinea sp.]
MSRLINLLALLPSTTLTLLIISIAFLRVYDETDFRLLGQLTDPKVWSNRFTVAALLVALVNLGVEWNRRNRETDRLAQAEQRRIEEAQRSAEAAERETRRTRIEIERDLAFLSFLAEPSDCNQQMLTQTIAVLSEYRDSL